MARAESRTFVADIPDPWDWKAYWAEQAQWNGIQQQRSRAVVACRWRFWTPVLSRWRSGAVNGARKGRRSVAMACTRCVTLFVLILLEEGWSIFNDQKRLGHEWDNTRWSIYMLSADKFRGLQSLTDSILQKWKPSFEVADGFRHVRGGKSTTDKQLAAEWRCLHLKPLSDFWSKWRCDALMWKLPESAIIACRIGIVRWSVKGKKREEVIGKRKRITSCVTIFDRPVPSIDRSLLCQARVKRKLGDVSPRRLLWPLFEALGRRFAWLAKTQASGAKLGELLSSTWVKQMYLCILMWHCICSRGGTAKKWELEEAKAREITSSGEGYEARYSEAKYVKALKNRDWAEKELIDQLSKECVVVAQTALFVWCGPFPKKKRSGGVLEYLW